MDKDEAIKPDVFRDFRAIDVPTMKKEEVDLETEALKSLSNHSGWKYLEEYIDRLQKEMKDMVSGMMANGSSFEDIGKITVVSNLAIEKLDQIKQKVNDSR